MKGPKNPTQCLNNIAQVNAETSDISACPACEEEIFFALKDAYHEFSLPLTTLLQCLQLAEHHGGVPTLPVEWWVQLQQRYELKLRI